MKTFIITAGDTVSEYRATTADGALELYARDAGMSDYRELVSEWGPVDSVHLLNTAAIVKALPAVVFADAFGGGVALVEGRAFRCWIDVCEQYGIDYCDYLMRIVPAGRRQG